MTPAEIDNMLNEAAERGARRALESLGLHDNEAGRDIRDLRGLVDAWREAKRAALTTVSKWVTMGVLGLLVFGFWNSGGKQ